MSGIECERRQHRIHYSLKIGIRFFLLGFAQAAVIQNTNFRLIQFRKQFTRQAFLRFMIEFRGQLADGGQLFTGSNHPARLCDTSFYLFANAGNAHYEELVHVRSEDGQELDAFQ